MTNTIEIKVPDIGDFDEVEIIEILVKPGDAIKNEDGLIVLESDKATMEVPSPASGVIKEIKVKVGEKVSEGTPILLLDGAAPAANAASAAQAAIQQAAQSAAHKAEPPRPAPTQEPAASAPAFDPARTVISAPVPAAPVKAEADDAALGKVHASPAVRKFARELGVNLVQVRGSGPQGRIVKEDVQGFVKQAVQAPREKAGTGFAVPEIPQVDFAKFGPIETKPLSRIKKLSGPNLHRNWLAIPHITQHDQADITELEAFRKAQSPQAEKQGIKLTLLAFMMKAAVSALKRHPEFNSSLEKGGENLILKNYYHIGVAVDTPEGLVVPVIRDADQKGVLDLAKELAAVSQRARERKLSPADMQGGTFSISSLGGIGGTHFTPIINAPEVAILGVGRSALQPVWSAEQKQFMPRLMLPLSLSYDHRVVDGALGARFITHLCGVLSDLRRAML